MADKLHFGITICGLDELHPLLFKKRQHRHYTHCISITDPGDDPVDLPESISVLRLAFYDVHYVTGLVSQILTAANRDEYPSMDHAEAILDFGRDLPAGANVICHCWAGVSRSTAAAALLVCQHRPGNEVAAFQFIKAIRRQAQPNRLIIRYGDHLLDAGGRMLAALDSMSNCHQ